MCVCVSVCEQVCVCVRVCACACVVMQSSQIKLVSGKLIYVFQTILGVKLPIYIWIDR